MDINYERIAEVNKGIKYTPVKGKNYAEVAQRVQAFRNLIPGGYITTEIIQFDPGVVYMKAECGYYENGQKVTLATGMAFERQDASNVNKTSYIENCETSAIGRALGNFGIGIDEAVCTADELIQKLSHEDDKPQKTEFEKAATAEKTATTKAVNKAIKNGETELKRAPLTEEELLRRYSLAMQHLANTQSIETLSSTQIDFIQNLIPQLFKAEKYKEHDALEDLFEKLKAEQLDDSINY